MNDKKELKKVLDKSVEVMEKLIELNGLNKKLDFVDYNRALIESGISLMIRLQERLEQSIKNELWEELKRQKKP